MKPILLVRLPFEPYEDSAFIRDHSEHVCTFLGKQLGSDYHVIVLPNVKNTESFEILGQPNNYVFVDEGHILEFQKMQSEQNELLKTLIEKVSDPSK